MSDDVQFLGVTPGEVQFLRVERPKTIKRSASPQNPPSPKTKKRSPTAEAPRAEAPRAEAPRAEAPRAEARADKIEGHFVVGDLVYHKDFGYCKVVGFTLKRVRIREKNGKDHVVSPESLHVQSHKAANTAKLPHFRHLRDVEEEYELLPDAYLDGLRYNAERPWPKGRDPPSPETRR